MAPSCLFQRFSVGKIALCGFAAGIFAGASSVNAEALATPTSACENHSYLVSDDLGSHAKERLTIASYDFSDVPEAAARSLNGYAFWIDNPDTMVSGIWNAVLMAARGNGTGIKLDARDVSGPLSAKWISESLLDVRIPWGRIAFTDLIFNIEDGASPFARDIL